MPDQILCYPCLTRYTITFTTLTANRYTCPRCGARGLVRTASLSQIISDEPETKLIGRILWIEGKANTMEI